MRDLRIETHHIRVCQRIDERQHVADRREEDVAARLVGLGLEREAQRVFLRPHVLAQIVDRVAEPLHGFLRILRRVRLDAFAPAPEDVRLGAELHAEVDGAHGFLQRVVAHAGVVARERSVAKDRIAEKVRGRHRDLHPRFVERPLEVADNAIAVGGARVSRHEVVVVQVDAVRPELRQLAHDARRRHRWPHGVAEGIAADVAHGPKAEGEMMFGLRSVWIGCHEEKVDR